HIGVQALHSAVIQWKNVVFCTLQQEKLLQFIQLRRVLRGYVVRLRPVIRRIEFPHIVVDSAPTGTPPRTNLVLLSELYNRAGGLPARRRFTGMPLPPNTLAELQRDMARLGFFVSQIREIEEARQKRLEQQPETGHHAMVRRLARI